MAQRRLAVVGVSRSPRDFTRAVFREFRKRGYEALPVNPNAAELEGGPCYPSVAGIAPAVEAALVMLPPAAIPKAVEECAAAGIRRLWIWRAGPSMEEFCRERAIDLVQGYCPLMFLEGAGAVHRFHGFLLKIGGKYPR